MIKKAGSLFVTAYLLLIFGVYPFYLKDGYVDVGEGKYEFFLYCSLGALFIFAIIALSSIGQSIYTRFRKKEVYLIEWDKIKISSTDIFVFMYLAVLSLSAVYSDFRKEALWGAEGWRMGLIVMALLCGLYLFISRFWDGTKIVWIVAGVCSVAVFLLGILDSFSFYLIPLPIREAGFISTLGNINWFCGYLSVLAPVGIGFWFFREIRVEENKFKFFTLKAVCLGIYTVIAFMAGLCQGSNSVFLWFGGLFFVLLWISAGNKRMLADWFFLLFLWGISAQLIRLARILFPGRYNYELNNLCGFFTETNISLWIALTALGGYGVLRYFSQRDQIFGSLEMQKSGKIRGMLIGVLFGVILLWVILSVVNTWTKWSGFLGAGLFLWDENWGNGRGMAIKAGFQMFKEMPFGKKLIGVGPDCFANFAYSVDEIAVGLREKFGASKLTNAHCELLTSLVNVGILGTLCYVGIFISFVGRCMKKGMEKPLLYIPAICAVCYLCHNVMSFAQVLNLPFVILVIAMGENILRNKEQGL